MKIKTGKGSVTLVVLLAIWSVSAIASLPGLAVSPILGDLNKVFPKVTDLEIQMLTSLPSLLIIPFVLLSGKLSEGRDKLKILIVGLSIFFLSGVACLFARSATVGGQKFPVHWGGDCSSNYLSMSESLRGGLSLCLSGFGFWSHDISGFEGTAPDDVYKRWAAFGLLSTHSRLHGSNSYRVPWLFGEEAVDVVRKFTNLKCTLMPYLFSAAVETHNTGVPTMRAMVLEFPNDIPCADLDRQYMLGGDLLVAPVFTKEGDVDYYLPEGTWTSFLDNRVVEGGKWQHEVHDFMSLPLMARENSLIAIGADDQNVEYDFGKDLTLHLFALKDKASADIKDMYGNDMLKAWAQNQDGKVTLKFQGRAENLKVLLRNVQSVKDLSGATAEEHELGTLLHVNAGLEEVTFQF